MKLLIEKTRAILIVSAVLCVVFVSGYAYLVFALSEEKKAVTELAEEVALHAGDSEKTQAAKHILADTADARAALRSIFFTEQDIVRFLDDMEMIAKNAGVTMKLVSIGARSGEGLALQVSIDGAWEGAMRFLFFLEQYPAPLSIEKATFAQDASSETGGSANIAWGGEISFVLKSYKE